MMEVVNAEEGGPHTTNYGDLLPLIFYLSRADYIYLIYIAMAADLNLFFQLVV